MDANLAVTQPTHDPRVRARWPYPTWAGLWRATALTVAAAGPLAVAVTRTVLPYRTATTTADTLADIAQHRWAESVVVWCAPIALTTLVPAAMLVAAVARRAAPALGTIATALAVPGFAAAGWLYATDLYADHAGTGARAVAVLDAANNSAPAQLLVAIFLAGHVFGTVLLGAALWKGHVLPWWLCLLLTVSQPLHAFSVIIYPSGILDGLAWTLTALGFAAAVATTRASPAIAGA